jgi:hypothetical protein
MLKRLYCGVGGPDRCEFLPRFCVIASGKTRTQMKKKFIFQNIFFLRIFARNQNQLLI